MTVPDAGMRVGTQRRGLFFYRSSWNRLPGGTPAWYSNNFRRGTETPLQTLRILMSSVGAHSFFDSQATFTTDRLEPGANLHVVAGRIQQLGLIRGIGLILAVL